MGGGGGISSVSSKSTTTLLSLVSLYSTDDREMGVAYKKLVTTLKVKKSVQRRKHGEDGRIKMDLNLI
jgi:hypothetical protein